MGPVLRRIGPLLDPSLGDRAGNYVAQSAMATVAMIAILLLEDVVLRAAIVVAMASTVFTIFVVPDSVAATPRKVIGGHVVGVVAGSLTAAVIGLPAVAPIVEDSRLLFDSLAALTVGLSIAVMVATNAEHPPAAGAALGLVVHGWALSSVGVILIGAVSLSIVRMILRPRLVNLL
jgi:CBS-domain-containing membrane protein